MLTESEFSNPTVTGAAGRAPAAKAVLALVLFGATQVTGASHPL